MTHIIMLTMTCPFCGKLHAVNVPEEELIAYQCGDTAQKAFPSLNATEREAIISRLCPTCQDDFFGSDEDDDEYEDFCDYELEMGFDPYMGEYSFDC